MAEERYQDLPAGDRRDALEVAERSSSQRVHLLEKDVWVVATLGVLFDGPLAEPLTFKGGTSQAFVLDRKTGATWFLKGAWIVKSFTPAPRESKPAPVVRKDPLPLEGFYQWTKSSGAIHPATPTVEARTMDQLLPSLISLQLHVYNLWATYLADQIKDGDCAPAQADEVLREWKRAMEERLEIDTIMTGVSVERTQAETEIAELLFAQVREAYDNDTRRIVKMTKEALEE